MKAAKDMDYRAKFKTRLDCERVYARIPPGTVSNLIVKTLGERYDDLQNVILIVDDEYDLFTISPETMVYPVREAA